MNPAGSPFASTFRRNPRTRVAVHAALIIISVVFAFPLLWMLSTSLKPIEEVMATPPRFIPSHLAWRNYGEAIAYIPFWRYTANTFISCTLAALGTTLAAVGGWRFARASSLPVTYARIPRSAALSTGFLRMTKARNPRDGLSRGRHVFCREGRNAPRRMIRVTDR